MKPQEKNIEREFFDKYAQDGYDRLTDEGYQKILNLFESSVKPESGQSLLDVGCATGIVTSKVKTQYPHLIVSGMDISPECIQQAKKLYPGISFFVGDAEKLDVPDESVDILCYFGILHHFPDFSNVAKEAHRILKVGGKIFSIDPNSNNPVFWLFRSRKSPFYCSVGVTAQERLITVKEFIRVFGGQFDAQAKVVSGIALKYVESKFMERFMGLYNLFDKLLGATPLANYIGAWVIGSATKTKK